MYIIQLLMTNPTVSNAPTTLRFQFDPATMSQAKWTAAWPTVSGSLAALVSGSTPQEPPVW